MFIWVALLVSCLANIWSQMRRIFCNCFGCRNIKPGPKSFEIADSKASEKEDGKQCIAESDDVNSPSLGYLIPKPVSKYQLKYIRCTISPDKDDHIVGASPSNPIIIEDHHVEPSGQEPEQNSFEQNVGSCDMFQQLTQSAIQGRLEFDETHVDDKMAMINSDDKVMTRLHQAGSPNDRQVYTEIDETESPSKKITQVNNLEDRQSISVMTSMSSTGGQQENPKIDPGNAKKDKVNGKHKRRKSKVTFAQLLEKYQKESEEKCAYWPSSAKTSRSSPRRKCNNRDWRKEKFNAEDTYSTFGTPMPMSLTPPYADSSWDMYDSWTHYPSYYRSSHQNYAAPRGSSFDQQSHAKDRFNKKESVRSSRDKKEVIKQVYRVKKDGRKCATSDSVSSNKEPMKVLTLATTSNEIKQSIVKSQSVKSEEKKLRVHKVKNELPLVKTESQLRCPLGLSYWQKKELQKLSAQELRKKSMAWVPKGAIKTKMMCKLLLQ